MPTVVIQGLNSAPSEINRSFAMDLSGGSIRPKGLILIYSRIMYRGLNVNENRPRIFYRFPFLQYDGPVLPPTFTSVEVICLQVRPKCDLKSFKS